MRFPLFPALLSFVLLLLAGCATPPPPPGLPAPKPWPDLAIDTFSDIHIYNPALGTSGAAWDQLISMAFQLFPESPQILQTEVDRVLADRPGLVLITGDLTKEGERASHELAARLLHPLVEAGIPVLVIPGNHDVDNPRAFGYTGDYPTVVPSVTPEEFARIYRDFGYGSALSRDPASLSYISEPVPGLRVLALDTCRYEENAGQLRQTTGGRIRDASWPWIDRVLDQAAKDGVRVVAMMHHVLVERFSGQARVFRDYVVADQEEVQRRLADRGVRIVFTGHFHTLAVSEAFPGGRAIADIGDGTLSNYPLGWRKITLKDQQLRLTTDYIRELPPGPGSDGFYNRALVIARDNTKDWVRFLLSKYGFSPDETRALADWFGPTYLALLRGNPVRPVGSVWPPEHLGAMGSLAVWFLGEVPEAVWKPNTADDLTWNRDLSGQD